MNISIIGPFSSLLKNKELIYNLVKRDITSKYKGSMLGVFWSIFTPVFMLAVYTFVFSVVFNTRWSGGESTGSKSEFALLLFSGLIVFNYFSEVINRAPTLIISHSNYVKKVVFPLEILSWVSVLSALFNALTSFLVWFIFYIIEMGMPHITILELPLVLLPLIFLVLGLSWFLSSLGVFLRDIGQIIGIIVTMIMFLSPIFYPLSAVPEKYQNILSLNPIAPIIESVRGVLFYGHGFNYGEYIVYLIISIIICVLGFLFFEKTRKGFSDVL
ncbi:ABC transporter permease [Photobacterium carnosum]|uniref:ABC transporter permease n=1 Tax=Photobacterium carnosum TaxID=2023717 RepID=UPI001E435CAC|nr:ABC transporter permease [Photobacterium carnosum]MCD9557545.1 ABC transporter permease [Photobacterium carnosum]